MKAVQSSLAILLVTLVGLLALRGPGLVTAQEGAAPPAGVKEPVYDEAGQLLLPPRYREWIFVGSSLGLSYTEGEARGHEMFHETLMEPGAYRHYVESGEFADGTQLVLILHGAADGVLPGRRGRFANEVHGVEMAVKDLDRFEEGWAYFGFGGMGGIRPSAEAFPPGSCHQCHAEHAAQDNVFTQFYPLLREAAGVELTVGRIEGGDPVVAYEGLDPVMLVAGREEMGKAEIVEDHRGWRYQFASEPHRAVFAADPARYAIQRGQTPGSDGSRASDFGAQFR